MSTFKLTPEYMRKRAGAYLVLLISLIPTVLAFYLVERNVEVRELARFLESASATQKLLTLQTRQHWTVLANLRDTLPPNAELSPSAWLRQLDALHIPLNAPGFAAAGFLECVDSAEALASLAERLRQQGVTNELPPWPGQVFYPMIYGVALDQDAELVPGGHAGAVPGWSRLLEEARDTGQPIASDVYPLAGTNRMKGFQVFVPVYHSGVPETTNARQQQLRGFVTAVVKPSTIFRRVIASSQMRDLSLEVYDGVKPEHQRLLFSSGSVAVGDVESFQPFADRLIRLPVLNRVWCIVFMTVPDFEGRTTRSLSKLLPYAALGIGLLISATLFWGALMQVRARHAVEQLNESLCISDENLRRSNQQLKQRIADKDRVEQSLAYERDLFRCLLDNLPDCVYFKDDQSCYLRASQEVARRLDCSSPDDLIGRSDLIYYSDECAHAILHEENQIIRSGEPVVGVVQKEVWRDGRITWALVTRMPLRNREGDIIGTFGIAKDITALKQYEEALAQEKDRLDITLRSLGEGVITTDIHRHVVLFNRAAEQLTGWTQDQASQVSLAAVFPLLHPQSRVPMPDGLDQVIKSGQAPAHEAAALLVCRDGSERFINFLAAPILPRHGPVTGAVLVFRDMTDRQRLEAERLKSNKLESVGLLAGGIAHEFNNRLAAILGNLSLARQVVQAPEALLARLLETERAAREAQEITQQFLTFSRGGAPVKKTLAPGQFLRESVSHALCENPVDCRFDLPESIPLIEADPGQLGQVVINLVRNAQEAMPAAGRLTVFVRAVALEPGQVPPLPPGSYLQIIFQDTGCGISQENLPKVFDPFFTTKKDCAAGLGLASAYSIISKHGGMLSLESTLGLGTRVLIYLPSLPAEPAVPASTPPAPSAAAAPPEAPSQPLVGGGRILVMDDEEDLRTLLAMMLELHGFEVSQAAEGQAAVNLYAAALTQGRPFDVVIMDLTIRDGMGGQEAIRNLKALHPAVKAIVSSGYSDDPVMANFRDYGFSAVVAKPFVIEDIKLAIQDLMGRPR